MSSENLLVIWEDLKIGIQAIFNMESIRRERYINLYSQVYNYCTFVDPKNVSLVNSTNINSRSQNGYHGNFLRSNDGPISSNQNGAKLIGWELYRKLKDFLKSHVIKLKTKGDGKYEEEMLKFVQQSWIEFSFSAKVLNGVCMYLNRNWVRRQLEEGHKQFHDIYTCALLAWTDFLLRPHQNAISEALIKEVEKERMNEQLNHKFLKSIIDCLVEVGRLSSNKSTIQAGQIMNTEITGTSLQGNQLDANLKSNFDLSIYIKIFETPFIERTERFYRIESMDFLSKNEITDYLKRVETRMIEEERRINNVIHLAPRQLTLEKLNVTLTKTLLADHLDRIINEFSPLLAAGRIPDLNRMFGLLHKIPDAFTMMTTHFENFVYQKGSEAISNTCSTILPEPKVYIETILDVYKNNYATVTLAFQNEIRFLKSLDKACERFINKNAVTEMAKTARKTPEFLAKYCDMLLKKSSRDINTDDLDDILSRFMTVFKYIEDKDVFQGFYSKMLARRLINDLSISEDIEASMISRLKESCGYEYTAKLQRMFSDKSTSRDLNTKFLTSSQNKCGCIDVNVMVLSSNSWPYTAQEKLSLSQELIPCNQSFIEFFNTAHTGRKLSWCFNLGRGEVVTNYTKKTYIFQVSTYQITILMLFNKSLSYTVKEIMDSTQLDINIVSQILQIFLRGKVLIVNNSKSNLENTTKIDLLTNLDSDEVADLSESSVVDLYTDYKNKRIRVNLNLQLKGETKQEVEEVILRVDNDRKMAVDASIVRVMKTRKTLKHQELVREVLEQLSSKFNPQVALIKRCISGLIEKEYLKRDNTYKDTYQYLA